MKRGMAYRSIVKTVDANGEPGRMRDALTHGIDAIDDTLHDTRLVAKQYLMMQYKPLFAHRSSSVVSTLMRVRHKTIERSIREF